MEFRGKNPFDQSERVKIFLRAVNAICEGFGLSLGHEDEHGAFQVHDYDPTYAQWLLDAQDKTQWPGEP